MDSLLVEFVTLILESDGYSKKLEAIDVVPQLASQLDVVMSYASTLENWNLKHHEFPSIDQWLDKNWTVPVGRDEASQYLSVIMTNRSRSYWGADNWDGWRDAARVRNILIDVLASAAGFVQVEPVKDTEKRRAQKNDATREEDWGLGNIDDLSDF